MNRRQPQSTSSAPYANHTARARAAPRNSCVRAGSARFAPHAPRPTPAVRTSTAPHQIGYPSIPCPSSVTNTTAVPATATPAQRASRPRSRSSMIQRNPAGANSSRSTSGSESNEIGPAAASPAFRRPTGPPAVHGSAAGPNSGVRVSHSTAAPYAPATKKLGTPRYDRAPFAATTAAINRATAPAPTSAPSVLVVTSTMLAVLTGENTCRPSTVALSARPTSVARRISARTAPERDVTTHTAPRPAKRTVFRRPSIASRHPSEGVKARASRAPAAVRSGEGWSWVRVASRTTAT